ncbi:MAG: hypothetical protein Q8O94_02455 [bacterium]|nr:hypothetical protein [bacterium]
MDFLRNLLHRKEKRSESVVLIDIGSDSVAGAYVRFTEGETPALLYTRRFVLEKREGEPHERAMLRALGILGDELIREGAPALLRATGSGSAETILVSVDTPWQETRLRTEHFERKNSFVFTESMVATAIEKTRAVPHGKFLADESIISTVLNGYETHYPYGKKVHRASVTVLSSLIDKSVAENVQITLRGLFHTKNILTIASSSLRYQALRAAFPHERAPDTSSLEQALCAANAGKLLLSGKPPRIVPVLPSHITGLVRQTAVTPPDLQLLLMALYFQYRI